MNRTFVRVECLVLEDGSAQSKKIIWLDGREFPIRRVIHSCPASNGEYEGIRYTVLIGSAEKYFTSLMHGGTWIQAKEGVDMKTYTSFQELDALGEGLAKKYTGDTHRWNSSCFDIEGFITDVLKLPILYEAFAEDDPSKIGFLSDGITPLIVYRAGKKTPVVFPKDTIVIESFLQRSDESGRRRFTLAHEAAHFILNRHVPMQTACFHNEYDHEFHYSGKELAKMFSLNETLTNRLGAAVLMPPFLVGRALKKYNNGQPIVYYTEGVFAPDTKIRLQSMSDALGVSYSALINRLRELKLLECRPIEEYIDRSLFPEGSI